MRKLLFGVLVFAFMVNLSFHADNALAGPASPFPLEVTQPDGKKFMAIIKGDEYQSWVETQDGYTIIKSKKTKIWEYAVEDKKGGITGSGIAVDPKGRPPEHIPRKLKPPRDVEMERMFYEQLFKSRKDGRQQTESQPLNAPSGEGTEVASGGMSLLSANPANYWYPHPVSGTKKLIVLLVSFTDRQINTAPSDWAPAVFSTVPGIKSVANYYNDNSFGSLSIVPISHTQAGGPPGVVTVSVAYNHPNGSSSNEVSWVNAALAEAANFVDFPSLDANGDGMLQNSEAIIYLVVAGYDSADSLKEPSIHGSAYITTTPSSYVAGGKAVTAYAKTGELNDDDVRHPMGDIAHELGHCMCGLPDLYDVTYTNQGLGPYSMMSFGMYGKTSTDAYKCETPVSLDAWSRQYLGWSAPRSAEPGGTLSFPAALSSATAPVKMVNDVISSTQYFLAENRQPTGWDEGLVSFMNCDNGGMLIQHIDITVGTSNNNGTIDGNDINMYMQGDRQGVMAEIAGYNPPDYPNEMFRSGVNTIFTDDTSPDSRLYNEKISGVTVENISAAGPVMTADVSISHSGDHCYNGVMDGDETDVDCGGTDCDKCLPHVSASASGMPKFIPANSTVTSSIAVTGYGAISDLNVQVSIDYQPWMAFLEIYLIAPDGTRIELSTYNGDGADFTNTVFDDEADVSIREGTPPFNGVFRPEDYLSRLDGSHIAGIWTLEVSNYEIFTGAINGWSLDFAVDDQPESTITSPADGSAVKGPSYTVTGTADDGEGVSTVEVSIDGGVWNQAEYTGGGSWSYEWATGSEGEHTIQARATDILSNVEYPPTSVTVTVDDTVPVTTIEPTGEVYQARMWVSIEKDDPAATIYYTTDGSTPDASSQAYSGPILMDAGVTVLKYFARDEAGNSEAVKSETYNITHPTWTRLWGTEWCDGAYSVATDASGNIFAAGYAYGYQTGCTGDCSSDAVICKYGTDGAEQWSRQFGTPATDVVRGAGTDSSGNVYAAGYTYGGFPGYTNAGGTDMFITKYDAGGVEKWTRQMGTSSTDRLYCMTVDQSGNVYAAGCTNGSFPSFTNAGNSDIFLTKYDSNGTEQWSQQMGTTAKDCVNGVCVDSSGNCYLTGLTAGAFNGYTNQGSNDIFVAKYNSSGDLQWVRQAGTSGSDESLGIAVGDSGCYATGRTSGAFTGFTNAGGDDIFIRGYDSSGNDIATQQTGSSGNDIAYAIAAGYSGKIFVAGSTDSGFSGHASAGGKDIIVVKLDEGGTVLWTGQMGTTGDDEALGVTTDGPGAVYVTGYTKGGLDGNTDNTMGYIEDVFVSKFEFDSPVSAITYPGDGANILRLGYTTITGTASDIGSGVLRVEISTDGGGSWETATDTSGDGTWSAWSYQWTIPAAGDYCLLSRATDKNGNIETTGTCVTVTGENVPFKGTAWVWGFNRYGQLGDGTDIDRWTPVQLEGLSELSMVSADDYFSRALKTDGTVWSWGYNWYGQLGDNTNTDRWNPVQVVFSDGVTPLSGVVAIAGGEASSVALKSDGTVWAWGSNYYGQLGDGTNTERWTPVQVVLSDGVTPLSGIVAIEGGASHAIALKSDGTVWTWGWNTNGQLGDGTNTDRNTPVQVVMSDGVTPLAGIVAIAGGGRHTAAIKTDGTVWTWGDNQYGQLGDGTNAERWNPVQVVLSDVVTPLTGVSAIRCGGGHTIALKADGTVLAWGVNGWGQLGDGTNTERWNPVQVVLPDGVTPLSGVTAIAVGNVHSMALKSTGIVWAWGANSLGTLGDGTNTNRWNPVQVSGLFGVAAITAGGWHSMALRPSLSSTIEYPVSGQTLQGTNALVSGTATDNGGSGLAYVEVSCDGGSTWNLAADTSGNGSWSTWSYDWTLQIDGDYCLLSRATDNTSNVESPGACVAVTVDADAEPPSSLITAPGNAALLSGTSYTITGTAADDDGGTGVQFVDVSTDGGETWHRAAGTTLWSYVWALPEEGNWHILSRATDNSGNVEKPGAGVLVEITTSLSTLWVWGSNSEGQLGDGTSADRWTPVQINGMTGVAAISCGTMFTLAVNSDGTVWAWGYNNLGQLGDGTNLKRLTPVQVIGLSGIKAVAGGNGFSVALKSDGTVWAWGTNTYGELGDGSYTDSWTPVQVSGLSGVISIAAGFGHAIALKSDGTVWAWGYNFYGQLGDGTYTKRNTPVQVSGLSGVIAAAAGHSSNIALESDGTVWVWGNNLNGQLGDGTNTKKNTPVQLSGLSGVSAVASGRWHTLAVKSDGGVWAWGNNSEGQLGDGTTTERWTPVQVSGLSGVSAVVGGGWHSLAVKSDGSIWTWGSNYTGELGDGTNLRRLTPVQASGLSGVSAIAGGEGHSVAVKHGGYGGGSPELVHYYWTPAMIPGGTDCTFCHATPGEFLASDFRDDPAFCNSCHNVSGNAHELSLHGSGSHTMFANATSFGSKRPTFGNITSGESNDVPYSRLKDGYMVTCVTCHNTMYKSDDPGRMWEYTITSDQYNYKLQNGGWYGRGGLVPKVYRDTSLWAPGGPAYSLDKKDYLVDPSEYTYSEMSGFIVFGSQQPATAYVYATIYYPYLRAPMQNNALCSDCHTEATHMGENCLSCHSAHNTDNLSGIRETVRTTDHSEKQVVLSNTAGVNSFADGDATFDGICEVCHTQTLYQKRDGSGTAHYNGEDCTACHTHASGYAK